MKVFLLMIEIVSIVKDDHPGLMKTFQSLAQQEDSNFSWLIVDGSEKQVIPEEHFQSAKFGIRVVHQPPIGIYKAMNLALSLAEEKMIWYLNADDILFNRTTVFDVNNLIENNPGYEAFGFAVRHLDRLGNVWHVSYPKIKFLRKNDYLIAHINHQGFICSVASLRKAGGFDQNLRLAADGKLLDQIVQNGNTFLSDMIVADFFLGGASGRNIAQTLKEIDSYRPFVGSELVHKIRNLVTILKTKIRFAILESEGRVPNMLRLFRTKNL